MLNGQSSGVLGLNPILTPPHQDLNSLWVYYLASWNLCFLESKNNACLQAQGEYAHRVWAWHSGRMPWVLTISILSSHPVTWDDLCLSPMSP